MITSPIRKTNLMVLAGALLMAGCGGSVVSSGALFEVTNDTYDAVDVYVDGTFVDTIQSNTVHTLDLGPGGFIHNVQIYKSGSNGGYQLNNDDVAFPDGVTKWDVYDNAPVVTVANNYQVGEAGAECVQVLVDGQQALFDLSSDNPYTPPSDSQICPGESGFLLVDYGPHRVEAVGVTSGTPYVDDTQTYGDGIHVPYKFP